MTHTTNFENKAEAALWLNEAWGRGDIRESDIRLRGNWLFYLDRDDQAEVECIHAPRTGDLMGEPWDAIAVDDSPFKLGDSEFQECLELLDKAIAGYLAEYA